MPATYEKMRVNGRLYRALDVAQELIRRGHPDLWIRRVVTKDNQGEAFKAMVDERLGGRGYQVSEHFCVDRSTDSQHVATNNPEAYERTYCGYPSQRMMIASDGTVYPCCVDYDGTMPMGKYTGKPGGTLLDIWHGERFQVLRETLRRNAFASPACRSCTSWMAYRAPQRDNVQDKAL
jgi:radical SAM protein with 4Fe4S-binding SPASM domain